MAPPGYFICECNPDQLLIEVMFKARKRTINHAGDRGRVLKALRKRNGPAMGVVDEDPYSGTSLDTLLERYSLREIEGERLSHLGIRLFTDGDKVVLALQPNLEGWSIRMARLCNIPLKKYGLPDDADALHTVINNNLKQLRSFLEDLLTCERLKEVKEIITRGCE